MGYLILNIAKIKEARMDKRRIYMDHSATTPTRAEVVDAMERFFTESYGNPSSIHAFGQWTRAAVEEARDRVAKLIGAEPKHIYFTSGGTESDNTAIKGIAFKNIEKKGHIITSAVEHKAILESAKFVESLGFDVTYLGVDKYGLVHPDDLRKALRKDTLLVSVMWANNEVGTIEPVAELARITREHGALFHTDAVQAVGKIPINLGALDIDYLSLSGHKLHAPKGVGVLYVFCTAADTSGSAGRAPRMFPQ